MKLPPALLALAIASFGIGTTEFVIMGLLPEVAADVGVSIPSAGLLVSGYALGVTLGAPLLAAATAGLPRRSALMALMALFIIGNLSCAVAADYNAMMLARVVTAVSHGAFFGLGAVVAAEIVPPGQRARALALMFAGLTLANVLGVPAGTALGQAFGWRATFWVVVAIGVAAALALMRWLPYAPMPRPISVAREARALIKPQVVLAIMISAFATASLFSIFTYIAPMLRQQADLSAMQSTLVLVLLGTGLTLGSVLGGRLGDWRLMPSVIGLFVAGMIAMALLGLAGPRPIIVVGLVFVWGVLGFALISPMQLRVVTQAHEAPNLASTLNQSAFNLGNAAGAWISGLALDFGASYAQLPWIGVALAGAGLALALLSYLLEHAEAVAQESAG